RAAVFGVGTFCAEQLKTGHSMLKKVHSLQSLAKKTVGSPKRVRHQANPALRLDFVNGRLQLTRGDVIPQKQTNKMAAIRQRFLFANDDLQWQRFGLRLLLKLFGARNRVVIGDGEGI